METIIEKLRRTRGWSQAELAKKLGWTQADVSRAESKRTALTEAKIRKLAKAFDVRPSVILGDAPVPEAGGFSETPTESLPDMPERNPLMEAIMGEAYKVWFNSPYRDLLPLDDLPSLVRACYMRVKQEGGKTDTKSLNARLVDMLAVFEVDAGPTVSQNGKPSVK